jgi:hypothetical protein
MHGKLAIRKFALDFGLAVGGVLGKAWNAPCAPTHSTHDALAIKAETLGAKLRNSALPALDARSERVFSPLLRELIEMRFRQDRRCQEVTRAVSPPPSGRLRRSKPASPRPRSPFATN